MAFVRYWRPGRAALGRASADARRRPYHPDRARGRAAFVDPLLAQFRARVEDARAFALRHRVVLIETASGIPIDMSLAALPFEARLIDRATPFVVNGQPTITTCSAEDLVVLKAFASRVQDWLDVEGVIVRQGPRLDRDLILKELRPLLELKEDDRAEPTLLALFRKHRREAGDDR